MAGQPRHGVEQLVQGVAVIVALRQLDPLMSLALAIPAEKGRCSVHGSSSSIAQTHQRRLICDRCDFEPFSSGHIHLCPCDRVCTRAVTSVTKSQASENAYFSGVFVDTALLPL